MMVSKNATHHIKMTQRQSDEVIRAIVRGREKKNTLSQMRIICKHIEKIHVSCIGIGILIHLICEIWCLCVCVCVCFIWECHLENQSNINFYSHKYCAYDWIDRKRDRNRNRERESEKSPLSVTKAERIRTRIKDNNVK